MKILFLFGAGASTGSEDEKPHKPPLSSDLFNELKTCYPLSWGILEEKPFRGDFEKAMSDELIRNPTKIAELQRQLAEYFFKFQPSRNSLYEQLIRKLSTEMDNIAFATLNYERLLELAILNAGFFPVCNQSSSFSERKVEVCFPHGCCHLWMDGIQSHPSNISFPFVDGVFDGPMKAIGDPYEFKHQILTNGVPPVMSCFDSGKTLSVGKLFIEQQR